MMETDAFELTLAALDELPAAGRLSLVLRHSARYPITSRGNVYTAALTPEGLALARRFGEGLAARRRKVGIILSSPISRCVDTATAIASGSAYPGLVHIERKLSHFALDPIWAALPAISRLEPPPQEIRSSLDLLLDHRPPGPVLDLFVTHDTVVGALAGYFTGQPMTGEAIPRFLEGMYFWQDGRRQRAWWRGKIYNLA